jgi:hypothetical protein
MGCFNTTGFLSKIPIRYGDRVVCFLAKIAQHSDCYGCTPYYPFSLVTPVCLPIRGEYNDYGSIENVDESEITKFIKNISGVENVEDFFDKASQCGNSPIKHQLERWKKYKEEYDNVLPLLTFYTEDQVPTLLFEHEEFYDKFTGHDRFYTDFFGEDKDTNWDKFWKNVDYLESLFTNYPDEMAKITKVRNYDKVKIFSRDMRDFSSLWLNYEGNNEEFENKLKQLKVVPLLMGGEGEYVLESLNNASLKDQVTMYNGCKDEIRRFNNLYMGLAEIPMYAGLSKTAGEQSYSYENMKNFLDLCVEQNNKLIEKEYES